MGLSNLSSDLQQSVINTIYLTFIHNYIPISYFFGSLISLLILIYRPSRLAVFFLVGFSILLFGYEYDKHIIAGLREQTLQSLGTAIPHQKFQKIVNLFISNLLPVGFYLLGWLLIYLGIISAGLKKSVKK